MVEEESHREKVPDKVESALGFTDSACVATPKAPVHKRMQSTSASKSTSTTQANAQAQAQAQPVVVVFGRRVVLFSRRAV